MRGTLAGQGKHHAVKSGLFVAGHRLQEVTRGEAVDVPGMQRRLMASLIASLALSLVLWGSFSRRLLGRRIVKDFQEQSRDQPRSDRFAESRTLHSAAFH